MRGKALTAREYRSAGGWAMDTYKAHLGDRESSNGSSCTTVPRIIRRPATTLVWSLIRSSVAWSNFIDDARPLVSLLGVQPLNNATWYRPRVTQHTNGGAGFGWCGGG
jgi:hypothetical protein